MPARQELAFVITSWLIYRRCQTAWFLRLEPPLYQGPAAGGLAWVYRQEQRLQFVSSPVIDADGTIYYVGKPYASGNNQDWYVYAVNSDGSPKRQTKLEEGIESYTLPFPGDTLPD